MSTINKKEYLKKYLSSSFDKDKKKKRKKKSKTNINRVNIIDDDAEVIEIFNEAVQEDLFGTQEDAPQIAGVYDERPLELRMDDFKDGNVWKQVSIKQEKIDEEEDVSDGNADNVWGQGKNGNRDKNVSSDDNTPPRRRKKSASPARRQKEDARGSRSNDESPPRKRRQDVSPIRKRRDDSESPPRRTKYDEAPERRRYDNGSPPRRTKYDHGSPPRRKGKDDDVSPPRKKSKDDDVSPPRRREKDYENSTRRKGKDDDDVSPPRQRNHDTVPPRKGGKNDDESPPRRRKGADGSPLRRKMNNDDSPQRRRGKDDDVSPTRRRGKDDDVSPPRRRGKDDNVSPPRRRGKDDDVSPPRKGRKDDDVSPPRRKGKEDDVSSPRKRYHEPSPPRKGRKDEDVSPPRRKKEADGSPLRRKTNDESPPRRRQNNSSPPNRRNYNDASPSSRKRINKAENNFPPRKRGNFDTSPDRRNEMHRNFAKKGQNEDFLPYIKKEFSPPTQDRILEKRPDRPDRGRKSRWGDPSTSDKMTKTLDGKTAGLQNSRDLVQETLALKKREDELFKNMSAEVSGANASAILRDRKTGKVRDLEKEAADKKEKSKEQEAIKEKYDKWGKGTKQVEDYNEKLQEDLYEMSKPLARYADDEDLERYLKEQEREGDPMLAYIRKKKRKEAVESGKPLKPQYEGEFMPNRFGIRPGHRWDGVDRSNGYEKKWFEIQNEKQAQREEVYKWNTEDM